MKHLIQATIAMAAATLCLSAAAAPVTFTANLSSAGEPVPTSTATGFATVSFDDALFSVNVQVSWTGLANTMAFGHIHCCTAVGNTGNAGVALGFNPLPALTTGSYNDTFTLSSTAFNNLLTGTTDGKAYVNIHTPGLYAGGEIRGFLTPALTVPEPGSLALAMLALGVAGFAGKKRSLAVR